MPIKPNCFTIHASGAPMNGIPLETGMSFSGVGRDSYIDFGGVTSIKLDSIPESSLSSNRLLRAEVKSKRPPQLTRASRRSESVLVRIDCANLRFTFPPLAAEMNLWPGGDGNIHPILQYGGSRHDQQKVQLFEIPHNRSMIVVDQRRAVGLLRNDHGSLRISHAGVPGIVAFLLTHARAQRQIRAVDWAWHNLNALRAQEDYLQLVLPAISGLERLRNEL